jgi:hypothetical protein
MTSNGLTIVDIAGSNGSHESALVILDLLCKNFKMIEQIFDHKKADPNQIKDTGSKK